MYQPLATHSEKSRGEQLFRYVSNGPAKAEHGCRLCATKTSWCNRWPRTDRSKDEELADIEKHLANVRALMATGVLV